MNNKNVKRFAAMFMAASLFLTGCGSAATDTTGDTETTDNQTDTGSKSTVDDADAVENAETETTEELSSSDYTTTTEGIENAPSINGLTCESQLVVDYAECFSVYYYNDGYKVIDVTDSAQYLLVPEGAETPAGLDENMRVLQQPLDTIYLAATSAMSLFAALDSVDAIRLSGAEESDWTVDAAVEAMEAGTLIYAGKYDEPDYELLVNEDCDLAIESTMILHDPQVQEMIEMLEIPVFIDRSSYEEHPLGRTEWIKAYAAMLNKEAEAEAFFDGQAQIMDDLNDYESTDETVTFFYINNSGSAVVRNPDDYISTMIELGGANNTFADLSGESDSTSISITMEQFYDTAIDSDYLIYNSSVDGTVLSVDDLLAKEPLLADFKAVQEGNVWTTEASMYQATDTIAQFIADIHRMITGAEASEMVFLKKLS